MLAHVFEQPQAIAVGQPHIGQAQVVAMLLHQLHRLKLARSAIGLEPHALQRKAQQLADVGFVIDDQDSAFAYHVRDSPLPGTER